MSDKMFTVVVTHYNQLEYYKTAIDSVLMQNYKNIELIFTDDCTQDINENEIIKYINNKKRENIKNVQIFIGKENLGTIKSLNRAVSNAKGDYILCFAADDALYDEEVLSNFRDELEKSADDVVGVSFQAYQYDIKLKKERESFVNPVSAEIINGYKPIQQFDILTTNCYIPMGSTAFKKSTFEEYGFFDEDFKIVEDWSFFLRVTRMGGRFIYSDFDGLKHRSGGVSHYEGNDTPPHILIYKNDTMLIFEKEVFPYMKVLSLSKQKEIYEYYNQVRLAQEKHIGNNSHLMKRKDIFKNNKKLSLYILLSYVKDFFIKNNRNIGLGFIGLIALWIVMCLLIFLIDYYNLKININIIRILEKVSGIFITIGVLATGVLFIFSKVTVLFYKIFK